MRDVVLVPVDVDEVQLDGSTEVVDCEVWLLDKIDEVVEEDVVVLVLVLKLEDTDADEDEG